MSRWYRIVTALLLSFAVGNAAAEENNPKVKMETSAGALVIELYPDKAPKTVENFLAYVKEGYYEGTIFHRVINDFMIQGGGFTPDMAKKDTRAAVINEADNGLKNDYGTIAMARTNDPHSATSQFFINVKDNDFLNHRNKTPRGWGYAVFGKVVDGEATLQAIKQVATTRKGYYQDVPVDPITIENVTVIE